MPARTKKTVAKETSEIKIFIRESCPFTDPMATSSPSNDSTDAKASGLINLMPPKRTLEMLCEKVINEEREKLEAFKEEIKRKWDLFSLTVDPDAIYYTCSEADSSKSEKDEVDNKRQREDDMLMPPPSQIKKGVKKAAKKIRSDSEDVQPVRGRQMQTRSSSRHRGEETVTALKISQDQEEVLLQNDGDSGMKTPAVKSFFRRNRHNIATVTPGPNVNAPQTILRRPNPGETAISLSGSPLLVASEQTSSVPQITIPLGDGRVMAVLAKDGLNPGDFPPMDPQTVSRLKMLQEFLVKL